MSIVSSLVISAPPQKDGRFWVSETHTDQLGLKHIYQYLAAAGTDTDAIMAAASIKLSMKG